MAKAKWELCTMEKDIQDKFLDSFDEREKLPSCRHSLQVFEKMKMVADISETLKDPLPSTTYVRPYGRAFGGT